MAIQYFGRISNKKPRSIFVLLGRSVPAVLNTLRLNCRSIHFATRTYQIGRRFLVVPNCAELVVVSFLDSTLVHANRSLVLV